MVIFLYVCLGGALGTGLRTLVGLAAQAAFGPTFPVGTLVVNLVGSFLISLFMAVGGEKGYLATPTRVVLCTGLMGGFTTYSSFNFETMRLAGSGAGGMAVLNVALTLGGCLGMGALGLLVGGRLVGP